MTTKTDADWALDLTAEQTLELLHLALKAQDMPSAACALRLLSVKDPHTAELLLATLDLASSV